MKIVMPRGDLRPVQFIVESLGRDPPELDEIYVTFKKAFTYSEFLFQKKLSDGTIEDLGDGNYRFVIEPEDTDNLNFASYVFDIELLGDGIKQTFTGNLILTEEATHATNEE